MSSILNQELAYYALLKLAKEMHEGLQLARNQKDHAPKFQARVEEMINNLIERFEELKPSLPVSDGPRYIFDRDGNHLRVYSPGDGGFKFTWLNDDNKAMGLRVSYDDAKRALMLPRHAGLKGLLVETTVGPELLPNVSRLGEKLLKMDDTVYNYELAVPYESDWWKTATFSFNCTPYLPQTTMTVEDGDEIRALRKFLANEQYYMPSVVDGDLLIDKATKREFVVSGVSEGSISVAGADDTFDAMYPHQLFERFDVPRLHAEHVEISLRHVAQFEAAESGTSQRGRIDPPATSPAP